MRRRTRLLRKNAADGWRETQLSLHSFLFFGGQAAPGLFCFVGDFNLSPLHLLKF